MFTGIWIFEFVLLGVGLARLGPDPEIRPYTCEEFEHGARFDPYEVIDSMWKIFYFWANTTELYPIIFSLPAKRRIERFRTVLEVVDPQLARAVQWRLATLVMEPRPGVQVMLMYSGTPGAFRALVKKEQRNTVRPHPVPLIKFADVRMKLVDRYMGMMCCEDLTMYALSRLYETPETELDCQKAAAKIGFPFGGGYSHLYAMNLTKRDIDDEL
ncbi:uncharacterized protein LOC126366214 [Pectinophora gossypiella]|uniref:uncharacterized protein LOC126366214 n=1 Tax=Pectinophora gossypiella TaxID=13191 RepID=UPI00214E7881|nr:uncharacterized protein LOC126366214 [Pectinophora gossypiella]